MLRFYKIQKPPSKDVVKACIDSVKVPDVQTLQSTLLDASKPSQVSVTEAILWCRGAHKLFDMNASKLAEIHGLQQKLESLAAQGLKKDLVEVQTTIDALCALGFQPASASSGIGDVKEAYEDLLDHVYDHRYQLRRSLRLAYMSRTMNA
jgi:hypothetical protein